MCYVPLNPLSLKTRSDRTDSNFDFFFSEEKEQKSKPNKAILLQLEEIKPISVLEHVALNFKHTAQSSM